MNAALLWSPVLHPGILGWDEYLLMGLGVLALIVIATMGGKRKDEPAENEEAAEEESS